MLLWPMQASAYLPQASGFVGLLALPQTDFSTFEISLSPALPVHQEPQVSSTVVGLLESTAAADAYEWSYEQLGLAVYGYHHDGQAGWFKILLKHAEQFGWIKQQPGFRLHTLGELVTDSLAYLTTEWNGNLYADPTLPESVQTVATSENHMPVTVASTARVAEQVWVLVVILDASPCSSAKTPAVKASGWVPALSTTGRLNVWFHSRGC